MQHLSVTAFAQGFTLFHANNGTNNFFYFLFCSALTQANTPVQIVHEGPAEAAGCFLDLRPLSLRKSCCQQLCAQRGHFPLVWKEGRGRMSRKGAASCRALKAKDDGFELQAGDDRQI